MAFIQKPKYWIDQAAEILTNETGLAHTRKDIYELAKNGKLSLCFYIPGLMYVQTDSVGHEHKGVWCEQLEHIILIPKKGGTLCDIKRVVQANSDDYYPVLNDNNVRLIADYPDVPSFKENSFDLKAINNEGETITVLV